MVNGTSLIAASSHGWTILWSLSHVLIHRMKERFLVRFWK